MGNAFTAALTAAVAITAPAYADVGDFLSQYELVKQYCYAAAGDRLVVGLVTEPLFTLSGITQYTRTLEKELSEYFGYREVAVTFDTDLFYRIKKLGADADEASVEAIIETARKRR